MKEKVQQSLRDSALNRWLMVFLVSALMFATYWFQDFYGGIKPLLESQYGFTSTQFGDMLLATSFANMAGMVIFGGMFLDKFGIRLTAIIFGAIAIIGTVLSALGAAGFFGDASSDKLLYMTIGRVIFGVGLETTCVLISRTIVKWFKGYELALAMAINMGIGRLGSAIGIAVSPDIAGNNASAAVTFAAGLVCVGFIFIMIYLFYDIKLDKQLSVTAKPASSEEQFKFSDLFKLMKDKSFLYITFLCVAFYAAVFPFIQYAPDILINKFGFTNTLPSQCPKLSLFGSEALGNASIFVVFFIFGIAFPLIPANIKDKKKKIIALASTSILFVLFISYFWGALSFWLKNGAKTAALIPLGTILFTPIFGRMIDKKGKAASMMMIGAGLLIFAHISLSLLNSLILCYLGLFSLGIAFSLVPAAMWPSVAKIVPEFRLGTAFATMFTIQNYGFGGLNKLIGKVVDAVNPDTLEKIKNIREALEAQGLKGVAISVKIEEMRQAGTLPVKDYTYPILMLVVLGVISIFLAMGLKKSSEEQGYGL